MGTTNKPMKKEKYIGFILVSEFDFFTRGYLVYLLHNLNYVVNVIFENINYGLSVRFDNGRFVNRPYGWQSTTHCRERACSFRI